MNLKKPKLEWEEKYSVGVSVIDSQHQMMFGIINELIEAIDTRTNEERLDKIIASIVQYKDLHFQTEEKYFKEFNYPEAPAHIAEHEGFKKKIAELKEKCSADKNEFAFQLVDFLEDWLIDHLMNVDQKYKACFTAHGLK